MMQRITRITCFDCFGFSKLQSCNPALPFHLSASSKMEGISSCVRDDKVASILSVNHSTLQSDGTSAGVCHFSLTSKTQAQMLVLYPYHSEFIGDTLPIV